MGLNNFCNKATNKSLHTRKDGRGRLETLTEINVIKKLKIGETMGKEEMLGRIKKEVFKVHSAILEFGELSFEDKLLNNKFFRGE